MSPITDFITRRSQSSLMMGVGAVFAGMAAATLHGNAEYLPATLCLLFVIFMQLAGNYYYLYYDESKNCGTFIDSHIQHTNPISVTMLREFSYGVMLLASMIGVTLAAMGGWWVFIIGIIIVVLSWFTCGGALPLLRTPFGLIPTFLLFGPLCVITTSLIQSAREAKEMLNWFDLTPAIYISVVMGLMAVNAYLLYGYSTIVTDLRNSKQSFANQSGRRITRTVFLINGLVYTTVSVFMCINLHLDLLALNLLPTIICFIIDIYIWWKMRAMPRYRLKELVPLGTLNMLIMGLLSFIIFELTGTPDDSTFTFF
ncbi:MAG: prenyltransferase [Bacteroides sp.]|nr:prenyltransferase [Bacteroides sp.]